MFRLLAISGSLRSASSNASVLRAAARLSPPRICIEVYDGVGDLPHFNPDLDMDRPPVDVCAFREIVGQCDGLLLATPEYAHGLPGAFKNALDWLVGSAVFPGKPVAFINIAPRAHIAQAQAREIITTMAGLVIEDASITLSLQGCVSTSDDLVADPIFSRQIRDALSRFTVAIEANPNRADRCA